MRQLESKIARLGRKIVMCNVKKCSGIDRNRSEGVLPRCLILEPAGRGARGGCVVIGINPGQATDKEKQHYKTDGATYDAFRRYWKNDLESKHQYYERTRKLLESFGLRGSILWTDLVKCQREDGAKGLPPMATLRKCSGRFLSKELALIPVQWPLIALGTEAFKALAYMYPDRTVIGVPHPTGAYGDKFSAHLPDGRLHDESNNAVQKSLSRPTGQLLWLPDVGKKSFSRD